MAGGQAPINTTQLAPFFYAMVVGEGRDAIGRVVELVAKGRARRRRRAEILAELATVPLTFVPHRYEWEYDDHGSMTEVRHDPGAPEAITPGRLDMAADPIRSAWTTRRSCYEHPDYYSIMVAFGCHSKCPFCVVGNVQEHAGGRAAVSTVDTVLQLATARRVRYGTNLVKLLFASSFAAQADLNPLDLRNLLGTMLSHGFRSRVGSLNIKQVDDELFRLIREAGQVRVTFAPKTGASLRQSVGKPCSRDDKLILVAQRAGHYGFGLNIYTMLGVPGEEPEHVRELAMLIAATRSALDPRRSLEVSINPVFAKAQTPYERYAALRPEQARARFAFLRRQLPTEEAIQWARVIDDPMTYYQPILSLGGPELARVLDRVSSEFRPTEETWRRAVSDEVPGGDRRCHRGRAADEILTWQHIVFNSHHMLALRLDAHRA